MKTDFAIITIRPDEYEAISTRFTPNPYKDPSSQHTYGISQIQIKDGKNCTVAIARTSRVGNDTSQQIANRIIHDLDPQMLLVVGIGGGVPENDFTLGDVIISSHIHNFDVNAVKGSQTTFDATGGIHPLISEIIGNLYLYQNAFVDWNSEASIMTPRPYLLLTDKRLKDLIDINVDEVWRDKVEQVLKWHFDKNQRGARAPKYLPGAIASSNTLVRSTALLAQWLQNARSIRAVEMEVAGVYQAGQQISKQYPIMAIRGISDIIGFKCDDNWTQYACHTAAAFTYAFIRAGIVDLSEKGVSSLDKIPPATSLPPIQPSHSLQDDIHTSTPNDNDSVQNSTNAKSPMSSQNSQGNNVTGLLIVIGFVVCLAAAIVLAIKFNASSTTFTIFNAIVSIVGIFLSSVQAFPVMNNHFKAVKFPRMRVPIRVFLVLLVLSIALNGFLLVQLNRTMSSSKPTGVGPTPNPTSIQGASPSSLIPVRQQTVVNDPLKDDNEGYEWDIENASSGSCNFVQGHYLLAAPAGVNNGIGCNTESSKGIFSNFVYQIEMTILTGMDNDKSGAGPTFRVDTVGNGQQYQVEFDVAGNWQVSTDSKVLTSKSEMCANPCPYFHNGLNQPNFITVRVSGNSIQVQVNGHTLGSYTDNTYASGFIGVQISPGTDNGSVAFSNVHVWQL